MLPASTPPPTSVGLCTFPPTLEAAIWSHQTYPGRGTLSWQVRSVDGEEVGSRAEQGVVDRVMQWEQNAARQYADDGVADGWDSEDSQPETAEQRYIRVRLMSGLCKVNGGEMGRHIGIQTGELVAISLCWGTSI